MGIDRLDEDDAPVVEDKHRPAEADHADVRKGRDGPADGEHGDAERGVAVGEMQDRATCHVDLRTAVAAEYGVGAAADRGEAYRKWEEAEPRFRQESAEHQRRGPTAEQAPVDRPADEPGSWRGKGGQYLDPPTNAEVGRGYERIRETEENIVTPAIQRIEAEDPERCLAGFEYRLKGEDRIKEKVAVALEERVRVPEEALATVKDAIRYTFQYTEERYSAGVQADIARLQANEFELVDRKNSWLDEEYKGINSRWRVSENGQLFEVQFHTRISFEAKQLTHPAYERIRNPTTSDEEVAELRSFQREVCAKVPIPAGAADIPDYPRR